MGKGGVMQQDMVKIVCGKCRAKMSGTRAQAEALEACPKCGAGRERFSFVAATAQTATQPMMQQPAQRAAQPNTQRMVRQQPQTQQPMMQQPGPRMPAPRGRLPGRPMQQYSAPQQPMGYGNQPAPMGYGQQPAPMGYGVPQPAPMGYGDPGMQQPMTGGSNGKALAAMILGIVGLVFALISLPFVFAGALVSTLFLIATCAVVLIPVGLAVVLGVMGRKQSKLTGVGGGKAMAGLVMGIIAAVGFGLILVLSMAFKSAVTEKYGKDPADIGKEFGANIQVAVLSTGVEAYQKSHSGEMPNTMQEVLAGLEPGAKTDDPWGRPIIYKKIDAQTCELRSLGINPSDPSDDIWWDSKTDQVKKGPQPGTGRR
jgi:hypothetical protein